MTDLCHVSLLETVFVAEGLVQLGSDLLNLLQVEVSEHVRELNDCFTTIADELVEELLVIICQDLGHGSKDETEQDIHHWYKRQLGS